MTMGWMRTTLAVAAALLLLVVGMPACGGDDDDGGDAVATQATSTEEAPAASVPDPTPAHLAEIREDYELNFSTTSWYTDPANLEIVGTELHARTDWPADSQGEALALQLCNALTGNYTLATAEYALETVEVFGAGEPPPVLAATDFVEGTCEN